MSTTRREFIKQFGVMLASLLASGCTPLARREPTPTPFVTCYEPAVPTLTPPPADLLTRQAEILTATVTDGTASPEATRQALAAIAREQLRAAWLQLDELATRTRTAFEGSEQARQDLEAAHHAALDELVARGELAGPVAARVQVAFEAAAYHIWRLNAPITCYLPVLVDYRPQTGSQLASQAALLAEGSDLEPATVEQVQAAIAREMAFLALSPEQVEAMYQEIQAAQEAGQPVPSFEDLDLAISAEDLAAARFLLDLLLAVEL